jgi:tetratricopeptide (TPR) repeat protein
LAGGEAPLKGVETHLTALDGNEAQYKKSDKRGIVEFRDVKPGRYLFQVQTRGYIPLRLTLDVKDDIQLTRVLLKTADFEKLEQQAAEAMQQGQPGATIEPLLLLLKGYPEDAHRVALAYGHLGRYEEALQAIHRAIELDPGNAALKDVQAVLKNNAGAQPR